ncbi:MAG: autotransporter domain-containing protein [Rhodopseudomonas sp.]|nr:autotransporter domain-containing protein [Rhodopseudomonas sp.]
MTSVSVAAIVAAQIEAASAHTVSIGYAFAGPGAVTFWYGSYHADATFNEANLQLTSTNGYYLLKDYDLLSAIKPAGLVDGVNNFYSNSAGTALVGTAEAVSSTDGSGGAFDPATQSVVNWQGVTMTGLRPGTYTFTYNPLATPTVEWHPINAIIETNTFTLTEADILGIDGYHYYGTNTNQRAVGNALDTSISAGGYNQRIYNIAALAADPMANALTSLSGEVHTQSSRAAFQPAGTFLSAMMDPSAGGVRGGDFGAAPASTSLYSTSPYGTDGGTADGASSGGSPYYDPQADNGGYAGYDGGNGAQSNTSPYGDPNDPHAPYDGNSGYGDSGYGNSGYGNSGNGNYGDGSRSRSAQGDRPRGLLRGPIFEHNWSIWQTTYGNYSTAKGDPVNGTHDTRVYGGGVIAGLDYRFASGGVLGVAIAGGTSGWTLSDSLGTGKGDVVQVGAYGSQRFGRAYVSGAVNAGWNKMSTDRTITIDGGDELRGSFTARTLGARAEAGYRLDVGSVGVTPHVAAQALSFSAPGYGETVVSGANDYALNIAARDTTQRRTEAGVWFDHATRLEEAVLMFRSRVAWVHETMDTPTVMASFQTLAGSGFNVMGATTAADRILVSTGAELRVANGFSINGKFDGEFADGSAYYTGSSTVRYQW